MPNGVASSLRHDVDKPSGHQIVLNVGWISRHRMSRRTARLVVLLYPSLDLTDLAVIRDFPRGLLLGERNDILEICLRGIRNCVNLMSCTWTRDGSLSTEILESLQHLPRLVELEINGHSPNQYQAVILTNFKALRKVSLIMPSSQVLEILPEWICATAHTLEHLTLICKASVSSSP